MKVISMFMTGSLTVLGVLALTACMGLSAGETTGGTASGEMRPPLVLDVTEASADFVQCKNPRPEICYEIYSPVCAVRDTGVRCLTTPCPSTEQATYPNDCQACSDARVIGFVAGSECQ